MKKYIKKYGKKAMIIYLVWCTAKGVAYLAIGKLLIG
jgi:hypothetical protein